jgi:hypothetical protein
MAIGPARKKPGVLFHWGTTEIWRAEIISPFYFPWPVKCPPASLGLLSAFVISAFESGKKLKTGNGFCFPDFCAVCASKTNMQPVDRGPGKKGPAN